MLPSWRNRIYIAISPDHISLLRLGRGLKIKIQARHDESVELSGKQPSWQTILDRLTQLLSQPEWQNAEINIVLSNRLVRYTTLLFNAQLRNYSVQESFARHALIQIFGPVAEHWMLRIQHGKAGGASLVTAIDRALLEGLRQVCAAHKLRLRAVTPHLMPVFNRYCKTIKHDPFWLVINEPGYSLFALLSGEGFVTINGVSHDNIRELPMLLDRENLVGAFAEPCKSVYVYTFAVDNLLALSATGYEFNKLDIATPDNFPSTAEGLYAMAMGGAR